MTALHLIKVIPGVRYLCHPHHRNNNPNKSQWRISEVAEVEAFTHSWLARWVTGKEAWGFHLVQNRVTYLGVAQDHVTEVFLAKFVDGSGTSEWHGYPADHQTNSQDRPPEELQRIWILTGTLPKPKIRKLARGQPCSL